MLPKIPQLLSYTHIFLCPYSPSFPEFVLRPSPTASRIRYEITSGNIGGAFAVKNMTGAIYVAGALDYETRRRVSKKPKKKEKKQEKNGNTATARLQKMKNAKWKPVEDSSVIDKRSFAAQIYLQHKRCGLSQLWDLFMSLESWENT